MILGSLNFRCGSTGDGRGYKAKGKMKKEVPSFLPFASFPFFPPQVWVSYWGPLRGAVLVTTTSAFLRDHRRSPWAFPRRWTNPRRIRKQIRRGHQRYFFAPSN